MRLNERTYCFCSVRDFDFCLAARIAVPAGRLNDLFGRPVPELALEVAALRSLEHQLGQLLTLPRTRSGQLLELLLQLGLERFTADHGWCDIFAAVSHLPSSHEGYARVAIERYVGYLQARQNALRTILGLRDRPTSAAAESRTTAFVSPPRAAATLERLPHGRAVTLKLERGREVTILLARHRFALTHDDDWALTADSGQRYVLRHGVNSVGRSDDNSIAIDGSMRNVSRTHLLAEPVGADAIVLTDVSSSGTFIPAAATAS
ncbi:MAG: FHA domain-containing protein [Gammaproteobacteria bacterium]